jgi:hypothetical protein
MAAAATTLVPPTPARRLLLTASPGTVQFKGTPLAGATVTLWLTNTNTIVQTATTGADGSYSFSSIQAEGNVAAVYQLWASKPGFGFYPSVGSGASVIRFDHTGNYHGNGVTDTAIYLTVIQFTAAPNVNLTDADFTAYDGSVPFVSLPRTGQVARYAGGDDGSLLKGTSWPDGRFTDNSDGTVSDHLTGLIWLRNAGCFSPALFATALVDVNQVASGACGLADGSKPGGWRLPNLNELESMIDVSQSNPALPAGSPFTNVQRHLLVVHQLFRGRDRFAHRMDNPPERWALRERFCQQHQGDLEQCGLGGQRHRRRDNQVAIDRTVHHLC